MKQSAAERAEEIDKMDFELFEDVHESIKHDRGVVKASPYPDVQLLGYVVGLSRKPKLDFRRPSQAQSHRL